MKRRVLLLAPLLIACGPFFYQAPPPLENYPQRIPGKSWREILTETLPAPRDPSTREQLLSECRALGTLLPDLIQEDRVARVDAMIARNRDGAFDAEVATYLLELRELVPDHGLLLAAQPYLRQRETLLGTWGGSSRDWIDKGLSTCPPSLEPNYRIQKAAWLFRHGSADDAIREFLSVMADYPGHPRAEVASFMIGRCLPAPYAGPGNFDRLHSYELQEHFKPAVEAYEDYLTKYPQGRFVADAHGWLAALMLDTKQSGEAVKHHLARWSARPSRLDITCILRDCEAIFADEIKDPHSGVDFLPWLEIAKRPEVARLFVFQALDPAAREGLPDLDRNLSSDGTTLNFLHRRVILPRPYAQASLKELGHAVMNAKDGNPDTLTLLILGWASQLGNEPAQALALFDRALATGKSDDLLQGRAMALSALGRYAEANATYRELVSTFPTSALVKASEFDRAITRYRAGEAGDALLDLLGRRLDNYGGLPAGEMIHPQLELRQWVDSIAQFGAIDALAKPLATLPADDPSAVLLRAVVRYRALAEHRFDLARQHLDPAPAEVEKPEGYRDLSYFDPSYLIGYEIPAMLPLLPMDEARWQRDIAPLADAYQRLETGGAQEAALHLEIGRRWKALRGRVTYPLQRLFDYSMSETETLDLLRRRNAAFLGVPAEEIVKQLDSRDELDQALAHFRKAAELSQDPAIAAPALEEANEMLFRLAEFSHYRVTRAIETDAAGLSARIAARLRADFPDRPETPRAATWTFTPLIMMGRWMPGDYSPASSAQAIPLSLGFPETVPPPPFPVRKNVRQGEDMEAIRQRLAQELADFNRSRPTLGEEMINHYGSELDDLISAAALPDITPQLFAGYQRIRCGDQSPATGDELVPDSPANWPGLEAHMAFRGRPRDTVESLRDYLARFPDSPKTEAASLTLLRLRVRNFALEPKVRAFHFPEAPIPNGYKRLTGQRAVAAEELESLKRDIAAHEARYPAGRYAADLAQLSALVAAATGDYETAIAKLSSILADPMHPELHKLTALHFAEISLRLLDLEQRAGVAAGFRKNPAALPWLRKMVMGDTCLFRLRPFMAWLEPTSPDLPPSP